jgi:hypothetical protein
MPEDMQITTFPECQSGDHKNCPKEHHCPPGQFGGSRCNCSCHIEFAIVGARPFPRLVFTPSEKDLRIAALEAELKACREALEPFAKAGKSIPPAITDAAQLVVRHEDGGSLYLNVGDLRRASRLLSKHEKEEKP